MNNVNHATRLSWVPVSFYMNVLYCFGASIMDSFVIYPGWTLVTGSDFMKLHQQQGQWVINAFVIPLIITAGFNILMLWVKPVNIPRKLIWISLGCMLVNWVMSFLVQIPIHKALGLAYDEKALLMLIRTNYIRVGVQVVQLVVVYHMLKKSLAVAR